MELSTIPSTLQNNLGGSIKAIYLSQTTLLLTDLLLFGIPCQNSFPGGLCQNTILGTLLTLVS